MAPKGSEVLGEWNRGWIGHRGAIRFENLLTPSEGNRESVTSWTSKFQEITKKVYNWGKKWPKKRDIFIIQKWYLIALPPHPPFLFFPPIYLSFLPIYLSFDQLWDSLHAFPACPLRNSCLFRPIPTLLLSSELSSRAIASSDSCPPAPLPPSPPASLIVLFCTEGYFCLQGYENVKTAHSISSYVNSHFPPEQTHFPTSDLPCCTSHLLLCATWVQGWGGNGLLLFIKQAATIPFFQLPADLKQEPWNLKSNCGSIIYLSMYMVCTST